MEELPVFKHVLQIPSTPFCVRFNEWKTVAYLFQGKPASWELNEDPFNILLSLLTKMGLSNVDREALSAAIPAILKGVEGFCLARGTDPVHGEDGTIHCYFETHPVEKLWLQSADEEHIDFRNRQEINNVAAGTCLAEVVPPKPSVNGSDVWGKVIPAKAGKPATITAGANVRLGADGKAYSEIDGSVKIDRSRIWVDNVKVVNGDVGFKTGNIEFNGDVQIKGDVGETFTVHAKGNITVEGIVDRAALSAEGDITINSGLYGKEKVLIQAKGNISVAFAENANIQSEGNIYVGSALINCEVHTKGKVYLKAMGKSLVGGHLIAEAGVEANCLGNPRLPTKTIVEFGVRPELVQHQRQLQTEFEYAEGERRMQIREELEELRERFEVQSHAQVAVKVSTYPGVVFRTGAASFEVKSEIRAITFYKLEGKNEISMRPCIPPKDKTKDGERERRGGK